MSNDAGRTAAGRRPRRAAGLIGGLTLLVVAGLIALLAGAFAVRDTGPDTSAPMSSASLRDPGVIERGRYLVAAGDCVGCHTVAGGEPFAGGREVQTPFGAITGPNLTPDESTGLGRWSADDFWNALHLGRRPDGALLYPAFPYPNYTRIRRADADAMFAFLRSLPAVRRPTPAPALRFPFDQRPLLHVWRALYFRPGVHRDDPVRDARWNRGAYLVQGLGHCSACHTERNLLGAERSGLDLAGALIPVLRWYAPPLRGDGVGGGGSWDPADLAALLQSGVSMRSAVSGPMAEVVARSLQHLSGDDIAAMVSYLASLPGDAPAPQAGPAPASAIAPPGAGERIYRDHCADCHGIGGEGKPPAYPPLVRNPSVSAPVAVNAIRMVLHGGFPPSTRLNPRPYGMPPFGQALSDAEVAAVVGYIRGAWGNAGSSVSPNEVAAGRSTPLD